MPAVFADNLTEEEKTLVSELERIASTWPDHLKLVVNPESVRGFFVVRTDSDGGLIYNDWGGQTIDAATVVARVPISSAVGRL